MSARAAASVGVAQRSDRAALNFHIAAVSLLFLLWTGAYLDASWHIHYGFAADSFFTPTHYLLHGAWLGLVTLVVGYVGLAARAGISVRRALPPGYGFLALGTGLWGVAGGADFVWHTAFGFEANLEAVYTPSHLALEVSSTFIVLGIIRHSLWRRTHLGASAASEVPLVAGLAMLFANAMWLTWYSDPLTNDFASGGWVVGGLSAMSAIEYAGTTGELAGVAGAILSSLVTMLFVLFALRHFDLAPGAVTAIVGFHSVFQAWVVDSWVYLPAFLTAAVVGDVLWAYARDAARDADPPELVYRVIGAAVPLVGMTLYFATVALVTGGIVWVEHLWVGSIALCTVAGLMASFAVVPPKLDVAG